jgi:hypothetical protein
MFAVIAELKLAGVNATYEYPGYLDITMNDASAFHIGTANGNWGWNHVDANGDEFESGEWEIEGTSTDAERIAIEILGLIHRNDPLKFYSIRQSVKLQKDIAQVQGLIAQADEMGRTIPVNYDTCVRLRRKADKLKQRIGMQYFDVIAELAKGK